MEQSVECYALSDFPIEGKSVNAAYLKDEISALRQILSGRKTTTHYSLFSPWRKQAGCGGSEEVTKRQALLILFLAVYARSGKKACESKMIDLPEGLSLNKPCGRWLEDMRDRPNDYPERNHIYKVLKTILEDLPTPEIILKTETLPKKVSLRTLQRIAAAERESLRLGKPLPKNVLRRVIQRCLPQCPLKGKR